MGGAHDSQARIVAVAATQAVRDAVRTALDALHRIAVDARVFEIPVQDERQALPPTTGVAPQSGDAGINAALAAFAALDYDECQHPMATVRCPGVLAIEGDVQAVVDELNSRKRELRAAMAAFGTSGWYTWRAKVPSWAHLNRLQAYREWHAFDAPLRRVGLSWAGHGHSIEQLRIGALMVRLEKQNRTHGHANIESELAYLAGFDPNEVVVIRKPVAPNPVANVVDFDRRRRLVKSALPLIVPAPLPAVGDLGDFVPGETTRAQRDDLAIDTPLIEALHVWRYQTAYRFRLPADPVPARVSFEANSLAIKPGKRSAIALTRPSKASLAALVAAIAHARGPVPGAPRVDEDQRVRVVGANRAHVYLVGDAQHVWRVPVGDLSAGLAQSSTGAIADA